MFIKRRRHKAKSLLPPDHHLDLEGAHGFKSSSVASNVKADSDTKQIKRLLSRNNQISATNTKLHGKVDELAGKVSGLKSILSGPELAKEKMRRMAEVLTDCEGAVVRMKRDITHRKAKETALREQNENLRNRVADRSELAEQQAGRIGELAAKLLLTEELERKKLAADLHDNFSQVLHVAKLKLSELRSQIDIKVRNRLSKEIQTLLVRANQSARSLSYQLSPPVLYELGLVPALEWLGEEMGRLFQLEVAVSFGRKALVLDEQTRVVLFRAARELLINVAKHAGVNAAAVRLRRVGDSVILTVEDHGKGFSPKLANDPKKTCGLGLFSTRERLSYLGGSMEIHSTSVKTVIDLVMPIVSGQ